MSSLLAIAPERRSTAVCMPSIRDGECSCSSEGFKKMRAASMSLIPRCTSRLPTIEGTERHSLSAAAELLSKLLSSQRIQGLYHKENMKNDKALRKHLVYRLTEGGAHLDFDSAVKDMPFAKQGKVPKGGEHSPWQLLEHLRIALWDILEFSHDPKHVSPKWPEGYWPKTEKPPSEAAWNKSAAEFRAHLKGIVALIQDDS